MGRAEQIFAVQVSCAMAEGVAGIHHRAKVRNRRNHRRQKARLAHQIFRSAPLCSHLMLLARFESGFVQEILRARPPLRAMKAAGVAEMGAGEPALMRRMTMGTARMNGVKRKMAKRGAGMTRRVDWMGHMLTGMTDMTMT